MWVYKGRVCEILHWRKSQQSLFVFLREEHWFARGASFLVIFEQSFTASSSLTSSTLETAQGSRFSPLLLLTYALTLPSTITTTSHHPPLLKHPHQPSPTPTKDVPSLLPKACGQMHSHHHRPCQLRPPVHFQLRFQPQDLPLHHPFSHQSRHPRLVPLSRPARQEEKTTAVVGA